MLKLLKKEANKTTTEKGAATYLTSQSDCLDLFATIGALRSAPEAEIAACFDRAWAENPDIALKTLFFARDIRGGLGERLVFRTILHRMAKDSAATVEKNLWAVSEYGRFDDLLVLLDTQVKDAVVRFIKKQLDEDMNALEMNEPVSLLGKWLPSINAHNADTVRYGKMLAQALGMTEATYRKMLARLRAQIAILENNLRERDYTFSYEKQPSGAMLKYRKAFLRNDGARYKAFLCDVEQGKATLHTGTLLPYEIIRPALAGYTGAAIEITGDERRSMDVTWKAQSDFTNGENALVVVDGSGSMITSGNLSPYAFMIDTLKAKRYASILA